MKKKKSNKKEKNGKKMKEEKKVKASFDQKQPSFVVFFLLSHLNWHKFPMKINFESI